MINWHNPSLLVATRHNHDLKSVQSGRSGVAAASYITSYTTKSEETPANQISMIQTVLERMASLGQDATELRALLCRCVMQFGRERQVHAQQAATYVRDLGDTFVSHKTIPMLSGRMVLTAINMHGPVRTGNEVDPHEPTQPSSSPSHSDVADTAMEAMPEPTSLPSVEHEPDTAMESMPETGTVERSMPVDADEAVDPGDDLADAEHLLDDTSSLPLSINGIAHQVEDYLHRGPTLSHLTFYDFVRHCKIWKTPSKPNASHHAMRESHPNFGERCHRYTPDKPLGIPRAIFSSNPRSNGSETHGDAYCVAMLAHFVPFSIISPLKPQDVTYEEAFQRANFSAKALQVMDNWAALSECDDARDAEQLLRRKREAFREHDNDRAATAIVEGQEPGIDNATADLDLETILDKAKKGSAETLNFMATLAASHWFGDNKTSNPPLPDDTVTDIHIPSTGPAFTKATKRQWAKQMLEVEAHSKAGAAAPVASTGVLAEALGFAQAAPDTTDGEEFVGPSRPIPALPTKVSQGKDIPPHELIQALIKERGLSASQTLAFKIAARHFFGELSGKSQDPLRMFMHGEAGTGKTVVVRLLRELLERYGKAKQIMFMAPTGKAACAIGGTTQHSAFAIHVQKKGLTHDELVKAQSMKDGANRTRHLQTTFQPVQWLFFDEVSMTSCEMMAEIDQALRIARERPDLAFGGLNVLFAGDLCQLAPVGSAALYSKASLASRASEPATMMELGRAAWLEVDHVVDFTEQKRMQDADMAAALSRLRLRSCTKDDVDLFNERVLRSAKHRDGVTLTGEDNAIVLARTNETVRTLNYQKAVAAAKFGKKELVICAAEDSSTFTMTASRRSALLGYNGNSRTKAGLGRIPIYKGMPVVYRGGNQSVSLGITNGAFASVESWDIKRDKWGHAVAQGVVLRFENAAKLNLEHLGQGCAPIVPTSSTIHIAAIDGQGETEHVKRSQVPIQPGFAMTVHSAQGMTSNGPVVVDLRRGGFDAYVSATRATRKEHLLLVAPVSLAQLNNPGLPKNLKSELRRLQKLAWRTKQEHDHDEWTLDSDHSKKRTRDDADANTSLPAGKRRALGPELSDTDVSPTCPFNHKATSQPVFT
ncbi:hypothetical protein CF319_g8238 [Tilletia indica]|nr:hypothetical protein CF319_g8238 [Tilletia indica]KAE8230467.1 hypothetical protein CF326_g4529 [Tilletia indica]